MRRNGGGAGKEKVAMSSTGRRLHRSSTTSSVDTHGEEERDVVRLQELMAAKDLDLISRIKRRRDDMSLRGCDSRDEIDVESGEAGGCDADQEIVAEEDGGEVAPVKSATEMSNQSQRSLRSRHPRGVRSVTESLIGALVPRKARSACMKRSLYEYPASVGHNHHQQRSNSAANGEANEYSGLDVTARKKTKTGGSKTRIPKASNICSSVDEDIEMEIAEVLFGLMKQSQQPDPGRDQEIKVSESKANKEDGEIGSGKVDVEQMKNSETLVEYELVKESHRSNTEMRNLVATKVSETATSECLKDTLEIGLTVSPKNDVEGFNNLVHGPEGSPTDVDKKAIERTKEHIMEMTVGVEDKSKIVDRLLQTGKTYGNSEDTKTAYINPSLFPLDIALRPSSSSMGHMQSRETMAFMDESSGAIAVAQVNNESQLWKVSRSRRKRCATHQYIAESILYHQRVTKMNQLLPSAATASQCSNLNDAPSARNDTSRTESPKVLLGGILASKVSQKTSPISGVDKERASEVFHLGELAHKKQHASQKAPQLLSSGKKMIAPALSFPGAQHQMVMGATSENSGTLNFVSPQKTPSLQKNSTHTIALSSSAFPTMDPAMSFFNTHQMSGEAPPFMTMIPSSGYAFPISAPVGNEGGSHGHAMPYFNGSLYSPPMFYASQPHNQQQQTWPLTSILPSGQSPSSHSSSVPKQPHHQQQHETNVGGRSLLQSSTIHSQLPHKNRAISSHRSRKPEAELAEQKPFIIENQISHGQRSGYNANQHSQNPAKQLSFTLMPSTRVADNGKTDKSVKQEQHHGPKVEVDISPSQAFSMSYTPFSASNAASGINFSSLTHKPPIFQSFPDVAHQIYVVPQTAEVTNQKKHQAKGKTGKDFTGADNARKAGVSPSPAFSNPVPYDQSAMVKGCSIFDSSAKTLSFNVASESANSKNYHLIQQQQQQKQLHFQRQQQLQIQQQQLAQVSRTKSPTQCSQPSSAGNPNSSYSPMLLPYPTQWNGSRPPMPQSMISLPTFSKNLPQQAMPSHSQTQISFGRHTVKQATAQGNGIPLMQSPSTVARALQSPSIKSPQMSTGNKSGLAASPRSQLNHETSSNVPSQKSSSSPVCRRNVPPIISTCPTQVSELKY